MNRPYIDELLTKVDSKYSLVIAAAKRSRQLIDGEEPLVEVKRGSKKPVTVALNEINDEKVIVSR